MRIRKFAEDQTDKFLAENPGVWREDVLFYGRKDEWNLRIRKAGESVRGPIEKWPEKVYRNPMCVARGDSTHVFKEDVLEEIERNAAENRRLRDMLLSDE